MATFALILDKPQPSVGAQLARDFPDHQKLNETTYFFKGNTNAVKATKDILEKSGVKSGAVIFRVTADYYGYSRTEFWDWIANSFVEGDGG